MIERWRPRSVRLRLALWFGASVVIVVLAYAVGVYLFVSRSLREELDRALHDDFESVEQWLEGRAGFNAASPFAREQHADGLQPFRGVEVWTPSGQLRFRSAGLEERPPAFSGSDYQYVSTVSKAGRRLRTLTGAHSVGTADYIVRVTRSQERIRHELNELLLGLGLGWPLAAVLAAAGGYHLARQTLMPIEHMTDQAQSITADRLRVRLAVDNPDDELGRLATVFNQMLQRIEEAFDRLSRFTADASHELRTPLTAIRSVGEVGLRDHHAPAGYRDVIGSMLEEADRLTALVGSLLFLSRADSGGNSINPSVVPLLSLATEVTEHLSVLAEERGQSIDVNGDASLQAITDPILLREALINMVDNAIKYSPRFGRIGVFVHAESAHHVAISVSDAGPGIAIEHQPRIFERFYRVDDGRSRDQGGSGLGLAIARWAAEACGGKIELHSELGRGSTFRIVLPAATRSSHDR
jgi:heavy metal sensor kinase